MIIHLIVLIFQALSTLVQTRDIPSTLNIAFLSSKTSNGGFDYSGSQSLQAMIMAANEVNNKTDGIVDDLLPNTKLRFVVRQPKRTFTIGVTAAQYVATTAFNGQGVIAAVGPAGLAGISLVTATGLLFNEQNVLQISHGAYYSQLSYGSVYKHLLRTVPSESFEGHALADIAYRYFKWSNMAVFHGLDYRSANTASSFQRYMDDAGVNILSRQQFAPKNPDYTNIIGNAAKTGAQIFIIIATTDDASNLIHQAYHAGLLKQGSQILGISTLNSYLLSKKLMTLNGDDESIVKAMLRGLITIKQTVNGKDTDERKAFVERWRSQRSTAGYRTSNGTLVCDQTYDMDTFATGTNKYLLYEDYLNSSKSSKICVGYDFSTYFDSNGSNILPTALYAYDAVHMLARGLHHLLYETSVSLTADNLKEVIIRNVSFPGVSGNVSLSTGGFDDLQFEEGDRLNGVLYKVYNFNPSYYDSLDSNYTGMVYVGTWETQAGLKPCDNAGDGICHEVIYKTADSVSPPLDAPVPIRVQMDPNMAIFIIMISTICMAISVFYAIILAVYRNTKVMKASQPPLLILILLGAFMAGMRANISAFYLSNLLCTLEMWTGHIAFNLSFMSIIAKLYRIHLLVNAKAFRKIKILTSSVLKIYTAVFICLLAYLVVIMYEGFPNVRTAVQRDKLQLTYSYTCHDDSPYYQNTLYVVEGMMLAMGLYLCYSTRDAPDIINESTGTGLACVMISFIVAIAFSAVKLLDLPYVINRLIEGVAFAMSGIAIVLILFLPKLIQLVAKGDIRLEGQLKSQIRKVKRSLASKPRVIPSVGQIDGNTGANSKDPSVVLNNIGNSNDNSVNGTNQNGNTRGLEKDMQECFDQLKYWKERKMVLHQMYEMHDDFSRKSSSAVHQSRNKSYISNLNPESEPRDKSSRWGNYFHLGNSFANIKDEQSVKT